MNIYLGNLNYGVKEQGFGFAEMSDDEAAKRAIEELSGKEFAGRALVIKEARPRA